GPATNHPRPDGVNPAFQAVVFGDGHVENIAPHAYPYLITLDDSSLYSLKPFSAGQLRYYWGEP
ncbi:MAG: hypothetical protein D6820_18355, partial [Lentisphaerae bacterium]